MLAYIHTKFYKDAKLKTTHKTFLNLILFISGFTCGKANFRKYVTHKIYFNVKYT